MAVKVKYVLSHVIQYFVPLIQRLAQRPEIELEVIFGTDAGARQYSDPGFQKEIAWDKPLLQGYKWTILKPGLPLDHQGFYMVRADGISRHLQSKSTDVVIIPGWANHLYLGATLTAFARGIPLCYRTEIQPFTPGRQFFRSLKPLTVHPLLRRIDGLLVIGSWNRQYYLDTGVPEDRLFWTPYSIEEKWFQRPSEEMVEKKAREIGLSPDSFRILFVGKLTEVKRPGDVIAAAAQMTSHAKVELIFIGDGVLLPKLKRQAEENHLRCYFLGFRNQSELPSLYSLGHVLVLPSSHEPWGLVVNEAMTLGLPAVVSDRVGCGPDLVREGESGFICPVGDVSAMAQALEQMASSPQLYNKLKEGVQQRIQNFSIERTVEGYIEAITTVVERRKRQKSHGLPRE